MHRWVWNEQILTIQKYYVSEVQLLLASGLTAAVARQVPLVRNSYRAVVAAAGLPTGALGSIWLSDWLCWPESHSLPGLLPLRGNLCKGTVAYKESRNWYIKYIDFLFV